MLPRIDKPKVETQHFTKLFILLAPMAVRMSLGPWLTDPVESKSSDRAGATEQQRKGRDKMSFILLQRSEYKQHKLLRPIYSRGKRNKHARVRTGLLTEFARPESGEEKERVVGRRGTRTESARSWSLGKARGVFLRRAVAQRPEEPG